MLVIRLAGQSRGQALGRGLRSAKDPKTPARRLLTTSTGPGGAGPRGRRAGSGRFGSRRHHRGGPACRSRLPPLRCPLGDSDARGWSSGDADVLDESTRRTRDMESVRHGHIARQGTRAYPGETVTPGSSSRSGGRIRVAMKITLEGHPAGQGGAIAQDCAWPEHADDGGAVMGDGLRRCQGGTDDVDVGRHPEGGACFGLADSRPWSAGWRRPAGRPGAGAPEQQTYHYRADLRQIQELEKGYRSLKATVGHKYGRVLDREATRERKWASE